MPMMTSFRRWLTSMPCAGVLAAALTLTAGAVRAEERTPSPDAAEAGTPAVVYEKKTVLDFSDVTLEGELTRPEGSYLLNRKRARFGSLVQLRGDFLPELQQSIDNL